MVLLGGSHGQLDFRINSMEDWLLWSLAIIPIIIILFLIRPYFTKSNNKH